MRKGFIFSLDALFAASIVIALIGMIYLMSSQNISSEGMGSEFSRLEVSDAAVVGFYQNDSASDYGLTEYPDQYQSKIISCAEYYTFGPGFNQALLCAEARE
jgi:hypothetical protein